MSNDASERVPESVRVEIQGLVDKRRKIEAIKLYREYAGCDLKDAKDAIDAWPLSEGVTALKAAGCLSVMVGVVCIGLVVVALG